MAVQPGDLPPYPAEHANRNFLRVSAILNCGIFGVPIEPGCLADVIADGGLPFPARSAERTAPPERGRRGAEPEPVVGPEPAAGRRPDRRCRLAGAPRPAGHQ